MRQRRSPASSRWRAAAQASAISRRKCRAGIRSEVLSALDGYTASSVDGEGFVVAERLRNGETEYALYDIRSQQLVTSDETFIAAEGYDGLYYTASVSEDGTTYTYVFYDGTEQVCTVSQKEEYLWSGGVYSFVDGNILYKGLNGEVYYGQRQGYAPVATPANTYELFTGSRVMPLGEEQAASFAVYDEGGSLIRIASPLSELERYVPDGATLSEPWYAGGRVFVQAVCSLPDDASAYDYVRNGTKYSADVLAYDLLSGGVEVLSGFGYVVDGTLGAGENCAVLLVRRIMENGRVSSAAVAQCFGKTAASSSTCRRSFPARSPSRRKAAMLRSPTACARRISAATTCWRRSRPRATPNGWARAGCGACPIPCRS